MNPPAQPENTVGNILFADDDEHLRLGLGKRLIKAGFTCDYAGSAPEALEKLKSKTYDVLLSDIYMPGNAGLELIESVPSIAEGLPVVLLTGNPSMATATRSVRLRVAAYLTKPPDFEELCAVLRSAIAEGQSLRTLRDSRRRLQNWDHDVEMIQKLLQQTTAAGYRPAMQSYLHLTLRNLVVGLVELENLLIENGDQVGAGQAIQTQELTSAVRKTISVLQKTRDHFKSKELGELRKELETLMSGVDGRKMENQQKNI